MYISRSTTETLTASPSSVIQMKTQATGGRKRQNCWHFMSGNPAFFIFEIKDYSSDRGPFLFSIFYKCFNYWGNIYSYIKDFELAFVLRLCGHKNTNIETVDHL